MGLRIDNVSLDAISAYKSVLLDVISIFAVEEHPGGASYNYLAVTSAVDFSVKFISSELLQFFSTLPVYVHRIYNLCCIDMRVVLALRHI